MVLPFPIRRGKLRVNTANTNQLRGRGVAAVS